MSEPAFEYFNSHGRSTSSNPSSPQILISTRAAANASKSAQCHFRLRSGQNFIASASSRSQRFRDVIASESLADSSAGKIFFNSAHVSIQGAQDAELSPETGFSTIPGEGRVSRRRASSTDALWEQKIPRFLAAQNKSIES